MPINPTYPGVYIEELPSAVRTITGVPTSITAFVGRAQRGQINYPVRIQNIGDFEREFGDLWVDSTMSYAVHQFFQNGGGDALIVRVAHVDAAASTFPAILGQANLPNPTGSLVLLASNPGSWGDNLRVRIDYNTRPYETGETADTLFNLTVKDMSTNTTEVHRNLSVESANRRFVTHVLEEESNMIRVSATTPVPPLRPVAHTNLPSLGADPFALGAGYYTQATAGSGSDGSAIDDPDMVGDQASKTGMYALENADLFNLLCLPPLTRDADVATSTYSTAVTYCEQRRALLIVDPPDWVDVQAATTNLDTFTSQVSRHRNAAFYFPRVRMPDPLKENRMEEFVPCGVVAGVIARTDVERGVWKAPAGRDATMFGVQELTVKMTDGENGLLNPLGVNCLRNFAIAGNVVWGARTLRGADELADQWKYIPVRRLALYIEESLYRGTQWVVFEPNDEPLWAQIRLNVGAFMQDLFRKGAFQGSSPREAYLVKCDKETTTQNDIDHGIVNIVVGFAPLKPAEFVMIKIQQLAGNIQT